MSNKKRSNKNCRRAEKKYEQEKLYEQLFPPYQPIYQYTIYFLNDATSEEEINDLLYIVQHTNHFVIDTESNFP